jgi:hypothetical protein
VEDSHELRLRHPETAGGKVALRSLLLHAVARVIPDPASRLDTFATGADIAGRLEAEVGQQVEDSGPSISSLRSSALQYSLLLVEGWLQPYSALSDAAARERGRSSTVAAGQDGGTDGELTGLRGMVMRGRDHFCDRSGAMRDVSTLVELPHRLSAPVLAPRPHPPPAATSACCCCL